VRPWIDVDHAAAWAAYEQAAREVTLGVILAAARAWLAGIDAPRYLPALSKWLAGRAGRSRRRSGFAARGRRKGRTARAITAASPTWRESPSSPTAPSKGLTAASYGPMAP
jgi:hypothetical protein